MTRKETRRTAYAISLITVLSAMSTVHGATYSWDNAVSGSWSNPAMWLPAGIPNGPTDSATIDVTGAAYTTTLDQDVTLDDFTLDSTDATFSMSGRNIEQLGTASLLNGLTIFRSSTWEGSGSLSNQALMIARNTSTNIDLAFTNEVGGHLTVQGLSGLTRLVVQDGFDNNGTLELTSINGNHYAEMRVTNGAITNNGVIDMNQGTGTTLPAGKTLQSDIINKPGGTVNININSSLNKTNGNYTNEGDWNIAAGQTNLWGNNSTFNQDDGTLDIDGQFLLTGGTFNFNGGNITGDVELSGSDLNIGPGSTGTGDFKLRSLCTITGDIAPAQTVTARATSGLTRLTSPTGFTNDGVFTLTSDSGIHNAELHVTTGTMVNKNTFNSQPGTGGARKLAGSLDNRPGAFTNINTHTTFEKTDAQYNNDGTFNTAAGAQLNINGAHLSGDTQAFTQNSNTLNNDGAFVVNGATFNFSGGSVNGNAIILNSSILNIGAGSTGPGAFIHRFAHGRISGDIAPAQTVTMQGFGGQTRTTADVGFTNYGLIELDSINGNHFSDLTITTGALVNEGVLDVNAGTGGTRTLGGELDNRNETNVHAPLFQLGRPNSHPGPVETADHANTGLFTLFNPSVTVQMRGNSFDNKTGGTIRGFGTIHELLDDQFVNNGTVSPGLDTAPGPSTTVLNWIGEFNQSPTGNFRVQLGGLTPGTEHDQISILGSAFLDGTIEVSLINGFQPAFEDEFLVVFASPNGQLLPGRNGFFSNGPTPGDPLARVPVVGGGCSPAVCSFDVLYTDTEVILLNFVPEPNSLVLFGLASMGVLLRRRRD